MKRLLAALFLTCATLLIAEENAILPPHQAEALEGKTLYISPAAAVDLDAEMGIQLSSTPERTVPRDANQSKEASHGH